MKKIFFLLFAIFFFQNTLFALNIKLDGTIERISGKKCGKATYRLGTRASYRNQPIDILIEVLKETNNYRGGECVNTEDNVLSFHLRNGGGFRNTKAYMDIKVTAVKRSTTTPITIDNFLITNFDLDRSDNLTETSTDDVYYKNPSNVYLIDQTNITHKEGQFYSQYSDKLKGQNSGNCDDSATLTTLECRAGVSFMNRSSFYARVENANAYAGIFKPSAHRLIQFSFEGKDIEPLIKKDFGDAPNRYTHVLHRISSKLYLGDSKPDGERDQQSSAHATGDGADDNDGVTSLPSLTMGDATYSVPLKIFNNTGERAYITAWIDFNKNGTFELDEAINSDNVSIPSSPNPKNINIVWDRTAISKAREGRAIMRIRLSTLKVARDNSDLRISPDGEVEDYEITINSNINSIPCEESAAMFHHLPTKMSLINLTTGEMNAIKSSLQTKHLNAAGYNKKDGFIWGVDQESKDGTLIRIGLNDKDEYIGTRFKIQNETFNSYIGDIDEHGHLYIKIGEEDTKTITVIDLDPKSATYLKKISNNLKLSKNLDIHDWAFNPIDGYLYAVTKNNNILYKINPNNGVVTPIGDTKINEKESNLGASFFDKNGNFYVYSNKSGTIYKIAIDKSPKATFFSYSDKVERNDGAMCSDITIDEPIKKFLGSFNIERTDSGNYPIMSDKRNVWYTQIVGRDFDYSVLFYNEEMNAEKNVSAVTIKIELINQDTNKTLYERYAYIPKDAPTSRVDVTRPTDDLASLPATQKAIFRISYGVDENNSIIQKECSSDFKSCYEESTKRHISYDYAKDNFAIRPESFYIMLNDKGSTLKINRDPNNNKNSRVRLATGYDYNLTVIATQKGGDTPALEYNTTIDRVLAFVKPSATSNCFDESNATYKESFKDGKNSTKLFEHYNVGSYNLYLNDKDWTRVDWNKTIPDCNIDESDTSIDGNKLSGCNIESKPKLFIQFYPYQFNVDFALNNIPNSNHPDFIYMTTSQDRTVALELNGLVTAQSADDENSTNFTEGCVAEDINLKINATTLTEDGINQLIQTSIDPTRDRTAVFFTRVVRYNNAVVEDINDSIARITDPLAIDRDKFLDINRGSALVNMRYNINKNLTETINPVQIELHSMDVNSSDSFSSTNEREDFIPKGNQSLNNIVKNFYFTHVVPDKPIYSLDCTETLGRRTPLNIDVFCDANISLFRRTNVVGHVIVSSSPREQSGWFILRDHNSSTDGGVLRLIPHNTQLELSFTPAVDENHTLEFTNGRNGLLITAVDECNKGSIYIEVDVPTHLKYRDPELTPCNPGPGPNPNNPKYCIDTAGRFTPSQWSGVGKAGKVMGIEANTQNSNKVDW